MNPLIPAAYANTAAGSVDFMQFLPMIGIFILFWFLLVRPQQKKAKEHRAMLDALQKNDEVLTQAGILGKIVQLDEQNVVLEIAANTRITIRREAIGLKLEKGSYRPQ